MAEEQAMTEALVLDNNREKLARRVNNLIKLRLENEKLSEISVKSNRQKLYFCELFIQYCYKYYGLKAIDLREITDNKEILALELEVFKKAKRDLKIFKYFGVPSLALLPVVGWIIIIVFWVSINDSIPPIGFVSHSYCKLREVLMEKEGKEFFPFETLKQILKPKTEETP